MKKIHPPGNSTWYMVFLIIFSGVSVFNFVVLKNDLHGHDARLRFLEANALFTVCINTTAEDVWVPHAQPPACDGCWAYTAKGVCEGNGGQYYESDGTALCITTTTRENCTTQRGKP